MGTILDAKIVPPTSQNQKTIEEDLLGVVKASLQHFREHFDDAARGTAAEGAAVLATLDDDLADSRAQGVVLESVSVAD